MHFNAKILKHLLIILTIFLSGCSFLKLKKEIDEINRTYAISGRIDSISEEKFPIIVMLYNAQDGKVEIKEYSITASNGHFSFFRPKGEYYLAAFEDLNNNFTYDSGERSGYFGAPTKISLPKSSEQSIDPLNLNFSIKKTDAFLAGFPVDIDVQKISRSVFAKFGQVTTLDDPMFTTANGTTGYWEPLTFLREFGVGVYFLERYDPEKIPVLFIHGAVGNPADWKKTIERLDRTK